jgi:hypothetical protein
MMLQTEVEFRLPKGYLDDSGTLHRDGTMRLATAADEILPLRETSVQKNPAYLTVIVLSRVVTRLGDVPLVTPATIERLFASDAEYLQELYNRLNHERSGESSVRCPQCQHEFQPELQSLGQS